MNLNQKIKIPQNSLIKKLFSPSLEQKRGRMGFLFVIPAVIILVLMMLMPLFRTALFAFSKVTLPAFSTEFIGTANFKKIFAMEEFPAVIKNTLVWIVGTVLLRVLLGFSAALIMDGETKAVRGMRVVALLPWTIPSIVAANSWRWMLRTDFGLVNGLLENIGLGMLASPWLIDAKTALPTVLVAYTWAGFPFVMMMFLAGLQTIPGELYESGAMDGANRLQQFIYITIPSLRSVIIMVVVLEVISAINAFDLLFVLTGGGPGTSSEILGLTIYRLGFSRFDFAGASAASTLLIIMALLCFLFYVPTQVIKKKGEK
jgi:multiple sugar transport system permease protein